MSKSKKIKISDNIICKSYICEPIKVGNNYIVYDIDEDGLINIDDSSIYYNPDFFELDIQEKLICPAIMFRCHEHSLEDHKETIICGPTHEWIQKSISYEALSLLGPHTVNDFGYMTNKERFVSLTEGLFISKSYEVNNEHGR